MRQVDEWAEGGGLLAGAVGTAAGGTYGLVTGFGAAIGLAAAGGPVAAVAGTLYACGAAAALGLGFGLVGAGLGVAGGNAAGWMIGAAVEGARRLHPH